MRKYLKLIGVLISISLIVFLGLLFIKSNSLNLFEKRLRDFKEPIISISAPIKNGTVEETLIIEKEGKLSLKLWAECYLGEC